MEEWHLDRKVTMGIILALLLNAGSSIWWASKLDVMVQAHSEKLVAHDIKLNTMQINDYKLSERLARMEEMLKSNAKVINRIDRAVK